ncbi:HAD family phosphatase [bacterium]|nr:HAD family phosphatase [bacterium]
MKYKLIIFDIDGTITKHISSWRYIHERLELWDTLAFQYQKQFLAGKLSYRKFCELDAAHWKGLSEEKVREIFQELPYASNVPSCIKRLKQRGFKIAAISTGLQYMAERAKKELRFDYVLSNQIVSRKGILTGRVKININHGEKGKISRQIMKRFCVKPHEVISVGDSAGDIPLAKSSGYSIAFNSSDKAFSDIVDYKCKTKDFEEVFAQIVSISGIST